MVTKEKTDGSKGGTNFSIVVIEACTELPLLAMNYLSMETDKREGLMKEFKQS